MNPLSTAALGAIAIVLSGCAAYPAGNGYYDNGYSGNGYYEPGYYARDGGVYDEGGYLVPYGYRYGGAYGDRYGGRYGDGYPGYPGTWRGRDRDTRGRPHHDQRPRKPEIQAPPNARVPQGVPGLPRDPDDERFAPGGRP